MKKYILAALVALVFIGCGDEQNQSSSAEVMLKKQSYYKTGDKIPLKGVNGKEVTLVRTENGFKLDGEDKILMIDIFGTFCEPCRDEAPNLTSFQVNNIDDFFMIGLNHFEDVTNEEIMQNFMKKYNAYYFIANNQENPNQKIIDQILLDIDYKKSLSVPFKVVYNKDGVMERLTDNEMRIAEGKQYYLGAVGSRILNADIGRIRDANAK